MRIESYKIDDSYKGILGGLSNIGGIQSNVMRKAVSDMQKDSVLHEYQYFVGNGKVNSAKADKLPILPDDTDGLVVLE